MVTLRAKFDGRVLIPIGPVDLPTDRELELAVRPAADPTPGSPEAIRQMLSQLQPIPREDIEAFERAIEEGKLPASETGIFDDER